MVGIALGGNWVWTGPQNNDEVQADFDSIFKRQLRLDGGVYLHSSAEDIWQTHNDLATRRGKHIPRTKTPSGHKQ
eukprot:9272597-Alexandrium_andersonii.AAC.1